MAPFNLENNIREKLESRDLKPSPEAWKKLEAQLDKKQPKKKLVLWYYAAASFVGLLILSSIFFSQINFVENQKLVDEKVNENSVEKQIDIIPEVSNEQIIASEDNLEVVKPKKKNTDEQVKPIPPKSESKVDKQIRKSEALAEASEYKATQVLKEDVIVEDENRLIDENVSQVAASIKIIQNSNSEVKVEEVEALLNKARRNIQTQQILNSSKVDATALLQEAEWELDKSFRDKVFDALGEGFQKLRTAISQRND